MLPKEELEKLIQGGESDRVEFTVSDDMDKIRKAICAFANDLPNEKKPGVVFIGITDGGECAGLEINDRFLQKFRMQGEIQPPPVIEVKKANLRGGDVVVIQVEPSDNTPIRCDGRCWVRVGPTQKQASAEEERRLTEKRVDATLTFDARGLTGASVDDLDMRWFKEEYLPYAFSPEALAENNRTPEEQMRALGLLDRHNRPTAAAILMLGKEPQSYFRYAYVQFVRFDGTSVTDNVVSQEEVTGTLPQQLNRLKSILQGNIRTALDTGDARHIKKPDYPYVALRELAHNAVVHRDYERLNAPIRAYWFTDRVEITNPGSVYGTMKREEFHRNPQMSHRNPTIAGMLKNLGFMERFGMGIALAREAADKNGNPAPEFIAEENDFFVKISSAQ